MKGPFEWSDSDEGVQIIDPPEIAAKHGAQIADIVGSCKYLLEEHSNVPRMQEVKTELAMLSKGPDDSFVGPTKVRPSMQNGFITGLLSVQARRIFPGIAGRTGELSLLTAAQLTACAKAAASNVARWKNKGGRPGTRFIVVPMVRELIQAHRHKPYSAESRQVIFDALLACGECAPDEGDAKQERTITALIVEAGKVS